MEEEHHKHHEMHEEEEKEPWFKGPIRWIMALFLLMIVMFWVIPSYSIKLNPEPSNIPTILDINSQFLVGVEIGNETGTDNLREAILRINTSNPTIKQVATKIVSDSCTQSKICHAKALYYFVRDNVDYVSDPYAKEYIASPVETLKTGGGDCDDGSLLLAAMLESIGIKTRIVTIPGHAFVKSDLPEAPLKYKIEDWVYMDWTCKNCEFGTIPYNNILQLSG